MTRLAHVIFASILVGGGSGEAAERTVHVLADLRSPLVAPVLTELRAAAEDATLVLGPLDSLDQPRDAPTIVLLRLDDRGAVQAMRSSGCTPSPGLRPEGFSIRRSAREGEPITWVAGFDRAGLLYGGFELAEQVAAHGWEGVRDTDQNPYMAMRGTKFNIPLDVRTPTYTDPGESAQFNIREMWSFEFWKRYIDEPGPPPLQLRLAVEPAPVSLAGPGSRVPRRRSRRRPAVHEHPPEALRAQRAGVRRPGDHRRRRDRPRHEHRREDRLLARVMAYGATATSASTS